MILNFQGSDDDYPSTISSINNTPLDNVKVFVYLGCNIKYNEATTGSAEIEFRIDTAQCKFYELGKKLMNLKIKLLTRIKIFNALVRSRLTYSCQTWSLTKAQSNHINATYMTLIRKMVRGGYRRVPNTYRYELSNKDLLRMCHTEDIHQFAARQQKKFIAHVIRSENGRSIKRLLFNGNEARRPGRRTTAYNTVMENEKLTANQLNRDAMTRKF